MTEHDGVPRVVVLGDALIDELVDDAGVSTDAVGGAALNVAAGLTRLGIPSTLVAMVGDDPDGAAIDAFLAARGIPLVRTDAPEGSARATSTRVDGEPTYVFNAAARGRLVRADQAVHELAAAAPAVVVSCVALDRDAQADELLALQRTGTPMVLDPNPRAGMLADRAAFARNLQRVGGGCLLVKVSDEDAALLGFSSLAALTTALLDGGARYVLATAGPAGATITGADWSVGAPIAVAPGPVVDTMGAGDSTLATTVAALVADGIPEDPAAWEAILHRAMAVAAATVRAYGAELQLPS